MKRNIIIGIMILMSVNVAGICSANLPPDELWYEDEGETRDREAKKRAYFVLAQFLDAIVAWALSSAYTSKGKSHFIYLVLLNAITPFLLFPLLFFTVVLMASNYAMDPVARVISVGVFEIGVVFVEAWVIYKLCNRRPADVADPGIRFSGALFVSMCANATSILVGSGGDRVVDIVSSIVHRFL
ncbi:MAG: hypothetical protein JW958_09045 [Candidatus Eisenbacteria bacterium]|nr:hypothetical protein [Candidatus Eisenbacteria bacterium]